MNTAYVDAAIRGELSELSQATNGNRNTALFKVAARLYEIVESGELSEHDADDRLWREAQALGLSNNEIKATLKSARKRTSGKPAIIPAERQKRDPAPTPKVYTDPDDYARDHGTPPTFFRAAGWRGATHDSRPALAIATATGERYRYLDGQEPRYHSPVNYRRSWYRLDEALALTHTTDQPLILCNGEASTVAAQYHGVAAFAVTGGSEKSSIPDNLLAELREAWDGAIDIAFDCDKAGRDSAPQVAAQLRAAGYRVRVLDLNGGPHFDLADFCRLHGGDAVSALAGLPELSPTDTTPDVGTLPFCIYRGRAIDQIVPPRQLIKGYLSIGTVALLIGASEAGKSTIAVDLANKVAQHYGVLYVAGEDAAQVRAQIRAWEIMHQKERSENLAVVDGPVDLSDRATVGAFIAAARTMRTRLVVIDTLSTCIPGIDENTSDVGPAVAALNRIADELDAAVLVLHHPLKYDNGTFRGHSSLMNNTHSLIVATRDAGDDLVVLTVTRHKGARAAPACLRLIIRDTDIVDQDEGVLAAPVALPIARVLLPANYLSARQKAILQYLLDLDADGGATVAEICREISASFKVTEGRVRTDIAALFRKHYISEGSQRQPRTITAEGTNAITSDQADQADQADQVEPFVVNAHLDTPPAPPNPIAPAPNTPSHQDAVEDEPDRPDRTRSELDRASCDQVDQPDHLIGVFSSDQVIRSRSTSEKIGGCGHESCRRAGLRVCGRLDTAGEERGEFADIPDPAGLITELKRQKAERDATQ